MKLNCCAKFMKPRVFRLFSGIKQGFHFYVGTEKFSESVPLNSDGLFQRIATFYRFLIEKVNK